MDNVVKLYLFQFLISAHFIGGVLVPFFTEWGGITFAQVMWLQSWFVLWIFLLEVPTGAVADRFGRKASLLCGAATMVLAVLVYTRWPDFRLFLLGEFLWALAAAFISGADEAFLYDSLKEQGREGQSKAALGRLWSLRTGAVMVSAPIGSLIASSYGLRAPVLLMAVPFAAALAVGTSFKEPPGGACAQKDYLGTLVSGVRYFLRHRVVLALTLDSVTVSALSFMAIWLSQPLLLSQGLPIAWLGFVFSLMTGAQILVSTRFERLEAMAGGRRRFLMWSGLIPGAAYLALAAVPWPAASALLLAVLAGLGLSRGVLIANYIHKHVDSSRRATVMSSVSMVRKLLLGALYPVVGWLERRSTGLTLAALGCAILACVWASRVREGDLQD